MRRASWPRYPAGDKRSAAPRGTAVLAEEAGVGSHPARSRPRRARPRAELSLPKFAAPGASGEHHEPPPGRSEPSEGLLAIARSQVVQPGGRAACWRVALRAAAHVVHVSSWSPDASRGTLGRRVPASTCCGQCLVEYDFLPASLPGWSSRIATSKATTSPRKPPIWPTCAIGSRPARRIGQCADWV